MTSNIYSKLEDPDYRQAFVASQINIGIPFQLRALLRATPWTQKQFAERAGMLQPRISAMLKPGGAKFNIETLRRLAAALDVALIVKFAPFSELVRLAENFDPDGFSVPTFEQEKESQASTSSSAAAEDLGELAEMRALNAEFEEHWHQPAPQGTDDPILPHETVWMTAKTENLDEIGIRRQATNP